MMDMSEDEVLLFALRHVRWCEEHILEACGEQPSIEDLNEAIAEAERRIGNGKNEVEGNAR